MKSCDAIIGLGNYSHVTDFTKLVSSHITDVYLKELNKDRNEANLKPYVLKTPVTIGLYGTTVGIPNFCYPVSICVEYTLEYPDGRLTPIILNFGSFQIDASNCGVGHIHRLNNVGFGKVGLANGALSLMENQFVKIWKRNYITGTVTNSQEVYSKSKTWLEKRGYVSRHQFVNPNSNHVGYLMSKDLTQSPITEMAWPKKS